MKRSTVAILVLLASLVASVALPQSKTAGSPGKTDEPKKPLVTFVELGSVKCVPCRQMQPVMASVEKKYGDQIAVVFHDVWMADQRQYAEQYGIRVIPTQVFLDRDGKEFHRHEGFYPEAEIDKLLQKRGLKVRSGG
jgi:thioredoxin 1